MPLLKIEEKLEKLYLPSTEAAANEEDKAWVVMDTSPMRAGDVSGAEQGMRQAEMGMAVLVERIREWNYTDEKNELVPITLQSVKALQMEDFSYLMSLIDMGDTMDLQQKKSSTVPSSTTSEQDQSSKNIPVNSQ